MEYFKTTADCDYKSKTNPTIVRRRLTKKQKQYGVFNNKKRKDKKSNLESGNFEIKFVSGDINTEKRDANDGAEGIAQRQSFSIKKKQKLNGEESNENATAWEQYSTGIPQKLLLQMGFEPGKGLGKDLQGITAPIEVEARYGKSALGYYEPEQPKPPPIPKDQEQYKQRSKKKKPRKNRQKQHKNNKKKDNPNQRYFLFCEQNNHAGNCYKNYLEQCCKICGKNNHSTAYCYWQIPIKTIESEKLITNPLISLIPPDKKIQQAFLNKEQKEYEIGEEVLIKQMGIPKGKFKLEQQYTGPFKIVQKLEANFYYILNSNEGKLEKVHVERMKENMCHKTTLMRLMPDI